MFEDSFEEMLQNLLLLLIAIAIVVVFYRASIPVTDSNQKFQSGEKAFCSFTRDTVLIQEILASSREDNMYKVLYKTKDGQFLSTEMPVDNLKKLAPKNQASQQR